MNTKSISKYRKLGNFSLEKINGGRVSVSASEVASAFGVCTTSGVAIGGAIGGAFGGNVVLPVVGSVPGYLAGGVLGGAGGTVAYGATCWWS